MIVILLTISIAIFLDLGQDGIDIIAEQGVNFLKPKIVQNKILPLKRPQLGMTSGILDQEYSGLASNFLALVCSICVTDFRSPAWQIQSQGWILKYFLDQGQAAD